jgi:DNA topoisomerase-1
MEWKLQQRSTEKGSRDMPQTKESTSRPASPIESASDARLSYVTDQRPGISRVRAGKGFRYYDSRGRLVRDPAVLRRIQSLVIPPAWKDVWICPEPRGHLQATGRDARNRKQYRYHPLYRAAREETKYGKLVAFGRTLPRIRRKVRHDLALPGLPEEKVLATVVRLMDLAQIRIGNEEYARENQSYGLTTMRNRHVKINGSTIHFEFKGKSGKTHVLDLQDRRLAAIVKRSRDLPGYELFQYLDERGAHIPLESGMVNRYLRETTGEDITAKDFRTWHGTVQAAQELGACGAASNKTEAKRNVVAATKAVAGRLGNRPATCRKHYIHPAVLELYEAGRLDGYMSAKTTGQKLHGLDPCERCVLKILSSQNGR